MMRALPVLRSAAEAAVGVLLTLLLFNLFADVGGHVGVFQTTLTVQEIQAVGLLSFFLMLLNALSTKYFGFALAR